MASSQKSKSEVRAQEVTVTDEVLTIGLVDGRSVSVPLSWYPRLWYANEEERANFELFGDSTYIHWPDLDEDLTVEGILDGNRSAEGPNSLKKWLEVREGRSKSTA